MHAVTKFASHDHGQPASMLRFGFKDGRSSAFSYGFLYRIDYDGAETVWLHFLHDVVTIRGRNLDQLIPKLQMQTESQILEEDELQAESAGIAFVTGIVIDCLQERG